MEGTETLDTSNELSDETLGIEPEGVDESTPDESNELSDETLEGIVKDPEEEEVEEIAEPKTYKVKIKGEERELTEDELRETFDIKPETVITDDVANVLIRAKNLEIAGRQALSEGANANKQAQAFMEILASNPMELLTDPRMPWNFEDLAIDFIAEKLRLEQMPAAERRAYEAEQKLKAYDKEKETQTKQQQQERMAAETEHHTNAFANEIVSVMEEAGLPETKLVFQRFAFHMQSLMRQAQAEGYNNYTPTAKEVLPLIEEELGGAISHFGKKADPDKLSKLLGNDGMSKIRKHEVGKITKKNAAPRRDAIPGNSEKNSNNMNKKLSIQEWKESLDNKFGRL